MSTLTVKNLQGTYPSNQITVPAGHKFYAPGCVVQVQSAIITGTSTYSSQGVNVWFDITGLSVNITPISTSSKVYVICHLNITGTVDNYNAYTRVVRNGTAIGVGVPESGYRDTGAAIGPRTWSQYHIQPSMISYLDSPATTSQLTYKVQVANGATTYVNRSVNGVNDNWSHVTSCTITVMEIAQ